jgi:hypothetical protein|nr:MAG TPA: hypothetical protein [Crassvirales sp.]
MCFVKRIPLDNYLKGEYKEITEILGEDLVVFKMVTKHTRSFPFFKDTYFAPFNSYEYKKKKVDTSPLKIDFRKDDTYIDIVVTNGFHSFRTLKDLKGHILWSPIYEVAKFIIPKGSTVIINDTQIVSDKIMFYKEINPYND